MTILTLKQATDHHSQEVVANLLGTSQAAISLAIKNERDIYLLRNKGSYTAFEVKPVFGTSPDLNKVKKHIEGGER